MRNLLERVFVVAMLFYTTRAILPFIAGDFGPFAQTEGNRLDFTIQAVFYVVAFYFIAVHWRTVARGAWQAKWILLLVLVAVASTLWSQYPLLSLRRSAVMIATTAFGFYFGSRFTTSEQLRLLAWTCALMVFASFAMAIFLPQYGVDHLYYPGAWQGAFTQRNLLARAMVFSVLVFYFARPPIAWWVRWLGIAAASVLMLLSRSATGIVVFAAMFATLPFYRLLRSRITFVAPLAIVVAIAAAGAGFLLYTNLPWLLAVLQRDTTLTGRTELWHALLPSIMARPWLGYGFNAFWMAQGESSNVMQQVNWLVKDADNGFLNLVLDLGILGLSILVAGYLVFWRRAVRLLRTTTGADAIWHCVYLVLVFLYNLTVSGLLVQNNIFWVLYVSTAVCVSLDARVPVARPAIYFERLSEA